MDFGKILDQWEQRERRLFSTAVPVYDKDTGFNQARESPFERRKRLLRKHPDSTIDLHGLNQHEAWDALDRFFDKAQKNGLEKLLVIHGKGNHAGQENPGILKETVRNFIERCPFAGESGHNNAAAGGSGSTWVLLKSRKATA